MKPIHEILLTEAVEQLTLRDQRISALEGASTPAPGNNDGLNQQLYEMHQQLQAANQTAQAERDQHQATLAQLATVTAERDAVLAEVARLNAAIDAAQIP